MKDRIDQIKGHISKGSESIKHHLERVGDKSQEILHRWEDKSRELIGDFLDMFGRDTRLVGDNSIFISLTTRSRLHLSLDFKPFCFINCISFADDFL